MSSGNSAVRKNAVHASTTILLWVLAGLEDVSIQQGSIGTFYTCRIYIRLHRPSLKKRELYGRARQTKSPCRVGGYLRLCSYFQSECRTACAEKSAVWSACTLEGGQLLDKVYVEARHLERNSSPTSIFKGPKSRPRNLTWKSKPQR